MSEHLHCRTQQERGEAVGLDHPAVSKVLFQIAELQKGTKPPTAKDAVTEYRI